MDVLLDQGFPIDYIGWGQTILHLAVGNGWLPLVEYLVKRGANLDLKGWRPYMTAREAAEESALNPHGSPDGCASWKFVEGGTSRRFARKKRSARQNV
jgi:ankyrin repeat protein